VSFWLGIRCLESLNADFGPEQPPETLVAFLDGKTPPSTTYSDKDQEPPRKRRKVTSSNAAIAPLPSAASDEYLTLARVDLSIVRQPSDSTELFRLTVGLGIPENLGRIISFTLLGWEKRAASRRSRGATSCPA
jgi:hypothetical protein